jgi:hypothetical protein
MGDSRNPMQQEPTLKIEIANPPNFEKIVAAFPKATGHGVIFAWGDTIYNPSGIEIPPPLLAHEAVHGQRQTENVGSIFRSEVVERWWDKYIIDPEFRYYEELPAHAAEFHKIMHMVHDRNQRAKLMMSTAQRLLAPLYNYGVPKSLNQAICDLRWAIEKKW